MTALNPFSPAQASATAGATVKVSANADGSTSVAGTIAAARANTSQTIVVTNNGTTMIFVRMSTEGTPTATAADYPLPAGAQVVLANPAYALTPAVALGLAVLSSAAVAGDVYFTPGTGE